MKIDKWVSGCNVVAFPWIDGKNIYVNVRYYKPGQAISHAPVWEKTAYIEDNERGRVLVFEYTDTLVNAFCIGKIKHGDYVRVG